MTKINEFLSLFQPININYFLDCNVKYVLFPPLFFLTFLCISTTSLKSVHAFLKLQLQCTCVLYRAILVKCNESFSILVVFTKSPQLLYIVTHV